MTVKIRLAETDARILPEMSAKVAFMSRAVAKEDNVPRVAVPAAAVVERHDRSVVYVVRDGKAAEVAVQTGAATGDLVPVNGIKAGEKIVLKPVDRVRDGVAVATAAR